MHKIGIVGLGYVGLPLAIIFSRKYNVTGFDINPKRISELKNFCDYTKQTNTEELVDSRINFTGSINELSNCDIVVVTVPTPVDEYNKPDLNPIVSATKTVATILKKGMTVVYESTVYPGLTEDVCVPLLEKESGLLWKKDFFVGYSPERVNPGDKNRTIDKITKVVSGDTDKTTDLLEKVYGEVITAGVYRAQNIKTAEAAKIIENTQRDLNIALMNELSQIFTKLDINIYDVIAAAKTKWNFLEFYPGLVGGHCIGVDPYYLTHKAEQIGHHPQIILSGRKINDEMGKYIADRTVKYLLKNKDSLKKKILVAGFTFKENIGDFRNTKSIDIVNELTLYGFKVDVFDPHVIIEDVKKEFSMINFVEDLSSVNKKYDALVIAVKHNDFFEIFNETMLERLLEENSLIFDVKNICTMNKNMKRFKNLTL